MKRLFTEYSASEPYPATPQDINKRDPAGYPAVIPPPPRSQADRFVLAIQLYCIDSFRKKADLMLKLTYPGIEHFNSRLNMVILGRTF